MSGNNFKQNLHSIKTKNGSLTNSPQETLKVLSDELLPSDGMPATETQQQDPDLQTVLKITAPNRLDRAIKELESYKSQVQIKL